MRAVDPVVVYRGFDVITLQLVETRLRLEGFEARRLGRVDPALLGAGGSAFEQAITVPEAQAEAASALIAELQATAADPATGAALEALAVSTPEVKVRPATDHRPLLGHFVVFAVVSALALSAIYLTR